jgi:hypothetical protein
MSQMTTDFYPGALRLQGRWSRTNTPFVHSPQRIKSPQTALCERYALRSACMQFSSQTFWFGNHNGQAHNIKQHTRACLHGYVAENGKIE